MASRQLIISQLNLTYFVSVIFVWTPLILLVSGCFSTSTASAPVPISITSGQYMPEYSRALRMTHFFLQRMEILASLAYISTLICKLIVNKPNNKKHACLNNAASFSEYMAEWFWKVRLYWKRPFTIVRFATPDFLFLRTLLACPRHGDRSLESECILSSCTQI